MENSENQNFQSIDSPQILIQVIVFQRNSVKIEATSMTMRAVNGLKWNRSHTN